MKTIHYSNLIIYFTSFIYSFYGFIESSEIGSFLILYVVLGISQPLLALILLLFLDWSDKPQMKSIKYYWGSVILFFLTTYAIVLFEIELLIKIIFIIPFLIATYFVYITYKYQKQCEK